jgi:hypothetical protein
MPVHPGSIPLKIAASAERSTRRCWKSWQLQPLRELHVAFKIPYVYDYITKLCRTQAEVILIHVNPNILRIGQGPLLHRRGGPISNPIHVWEAIKILVMDHEGSEARNNCAGGGPQPFNRPTDRLTDREKQRSLQLWEPLPTNDCWGQQN